MTRFVDPFTTVWFRSGVVWGVATLVIGVAVALMWRRTRPESAPIVAALIVGGAFVAMPAARETPDGLWQGVGLLAVGGALFPWARRVPLLPALLALPGAWWITERAELPVEGWRVTLLVALIVVGAPLVASFDGEYRSSAFGPLLATLSLLGAFTTLPDTEEILVLVGVALPLALLAWPIPLARLGAFGVYPLIGVFAWVISWGGRGRDTAIIGAVAGLGLLVVEPIVRWARGSTIVTLVPPSIFGPVVVGIAQLGVVAVTARVAGLRSDVLVASAIAVAALGIAGLLLALSPRKVEAHPPRSTR